MECDACGKEATVFLTQIVQNEMKKMSLCEDCARERGVADPAGFALAKMLQGAASQSSPPPPPPAPKMLREKSCPVCGFTESQFRKVGRLGCAACYQAFREEIEGLLRPMHRAVRHEGKTPRGLEALRARLAGAVAREDYEEAGRLRDCIRSIEDESAAELGPGPRRGGESCS
ncbi:MAG TPA: UvrB/UvrC motif-containing protein [Verrucomicrobiales bacterium]|nr:UvrB/UvrC motif-containing protein [Verrucomicrobiales bacterium]